MNTEKVDSKRVKFLKKGIVILSVIVFIISCAYIAKVFIGGNILDYLGEEDESISTINGDIVDAKEEAKRIKAEKERQESLEKNNRINSLIEEADYLAKGYFYEEAIEKIKSYKDDYTTEDKLLAKIQTYKNEQESLIPYEGSISHVFFHSLIADTSKAFDGDYMENGYNYWMTTADEFKHMLEQMYDRGYVLVSIHDVASRDNDDNGTYKLNKIMLPKGKIPFVLSQDDVNYYDYMKNDGFASKIIIDEDGNSACEMKIGDEIKVARDYDVIPIVDEFVEKHPDFSYKGAKGIIAVTGYEGVLGYRTNDKNSPTYTKDKEKAKEVAKALKKKGWEFASHSYGHRHMKEYPMEKFKNDCKKWEKEVQSLIGETDIYIYPYGEEIDYDGVKYTYLKKKGFNYFCGVYAKPWILVEDEYVRMTRRNLDGFTMHFYPERVKDLFDIDYVYDKSRPEFKE